jgi:hypothetical protein
MTRKDPEYAAIAEELVDVLRARHLGDNPKPLPVFMDALDAARDLFPSVYENHLNHLKNEGVSK